MVGPRASSSSSHVREGKDNSAPLSREFGVVRFKIEHELAKEGFRFRNVSGIIVQNLRFEFLILNNGKRRAVVGAGWHRQQQQERNQKPNRDSSPTCRAIQHRQ